MSRTPQRTLLLALLLAAACCVSPAAEDEIMREEHVVRLFVAGTPTAEIVRRIQASTTAFSLDEEMLEELRLAGLPEAVLEAMVVRQRELDPPPSPDPADATIADPIGEASGFELLLNPPGDPDGERARAVLRLPDAIGPEAYEALRLRGDVDHYANVAIFLACLTADHVPDHWRNETPLGRDFVSMPRHRILVFHAAAKGSDSGNPPVPQDAADQAAPSGTLEIEIPERWHVDLESGVAHDLLLGVALLAGERWYRVQSASYEEAVVGDEGLVLRARISGPTAVGTDLVQIRFLD